MEMSEESQNELLEIIQRNNLCIFAVHEGEEREKGEESLFTKM